MILKLIFAFILSTPLAHAAAWTLMNPKANIPPFKVTPEEKIRFANISALAAELHENFNKSRTEPLKRTQHHKIHGCLKGKFVVAPSFDTKLSTTLFKKDAVYNVVARFSNINKDEDNHKDLHGLGIKVLDPSRKENELIGQDFLANDTPKHFVRTPEQLLDFLHFMSGNRLPTPDRLLLLYNASEQSAHRHSLLEASYHSRTHFQFGRKFVRYGFFPCDKKDFSSVEITENHLSQNLRQEALKGICMQMKVQVYDPKLDPVVNDYTEEWHTPYKTVAILVFPKQDPRKNAQTCEAISFDPWRSLDEHKPHGILNKARWYIYRTSRIESKK